MFISSLSGREMLLQEITFSANPVYFFNLSFFFPAIVTCLHEVGHRKEASFKKLFSEHPSTP